MNPENRYNLRTHGSHPLDKQTTPTTKRNTPAITSTPTVAMTTTASIGTSSTTVSSPSIVLAGSSNSQPTVTHNSRTTPVVPSTIFANTPRHQLESFSGTNQDPTRWLSWYDRYCTYYRLTQDVDKMADFPFHLTEHARAWYDTIVIPPTFRELREMFEARFQQTHSMDFMAIKRAPSESVQDYFLRLCKCKPNGLSEEWVKGLAIRGLRDELRTIVMPQNPASLEAARRASLLAEETLNMTKSTSVASLQPTHFESIVLDQLAQLKLELAKMKETQHTKRDDNNARDDRRSYQQRNYRGQSRKGYQHQHHRFQQQPHPCPNQQPSNQPQPNRRNGQYRGTGGKHFSMSSFQSNNH